jgi:hypothetical protein
MDNFRISDGVVFISRSAQACRAARRIDGGAFLFYSFCLLVYTGLDCVGMWKSASRYEGIGFFPFYTKG